MTDKLKAAARLLMPGVIVSGYYLFKHRAVVSHRAEVDLTKNLTFGRKSVVGSFTKIKASHGPVNFGDRAGVACGCYITAGEGGIQIGDNFICGANVNIISVNYQYGELDVHLEDQGYRSVGITIGSNVWIGSNSTVTDGAVIGDNTIVAANSLVNRRYPPNVILQGNPAKILMKR